jgi:hypothetical protein
LSNCDIEPMVAQSCWWLSFGELPNRERIELQKSSLDDSSVENVDCSISIPSMVENGNPR